MFSCVECCTGTTRTRGIFGNLFRFGRNEPQRTECQKFKQSTFECSVNCGCCLYKTACLCRRCMRSRFQLSSEINPREPKEGEILEANEFPKISTGITDQRPMNNTTGFNADPTSRIRTDFDQSQLFLIQLLTVFDMLTILAEYLIPAVVMFDNVQNSISYRTALNLGCRLTFMLLTFSRLVAEWILVVYGIERILVLRRACASTLVRQNMLNLESQHISYSRTALSTLKLKIGMSLFIALSFSGICNYTWMIGGVTPVTYQLANGSVVIQLELTCSLRQEYYSFYMHFLVYVEFILLVMLPQAIHLGSVIIILFYMAKALRFIFKRLRSNEKTDTKTSKTLTDNSVVLCTRSNSGEITQGSLNQHPFNSRLTASTPGHTTKCKWNRINFSTTLFLVNALVRICLSASKNVDTFAAIFLKLTNTSPFSQPCAMLTWPIVGTVNLVLLFLAVCTSVTNPIK